MSTATFDLSDPSTPEALKTAQVGVPIEVTITPTSISGTVLQADVGVEEEMEEPEAEMEPEEPMPEKKSPAGKKLPGAVVAIMVGKPKK